MTIGIEQQRATTPWAVDAVRAGDRDRLHGLFATCSTETIERRFFGRVARLPRGYLETALAGDPHRHDAVVARYGDGLHIAALASLARPAGVDPDAAELGVLVADPWQGRGVGGALVDRLIARARERGLTRIAASVRPERRPLLDALGRRLAVERAVLSTGAVTGVFLL